MRGITAITAAVLAVVPVLQVVAVPNVTVVPLPSDSCVSWPSWINTRDADVTGTFEFIVDQADDEGLEGLRAWPQERTWGGKNVTHLVIDLRKSKMFARPTYRCFNSTVKLGYDAGEAVRVRKGVRNGLLTLEDEESYKLEPYAHEIDGVRQPGVFIGAKGRTTWGFNYDGWESCNGVGYYEAKLQGLPLDPLDPATQPSASYDPESFGFLKAVVW